MLFFGSGFAEHLGDTLKKKNHPVKWGIALPDYTTEA